MKKYKLILINTVLSFFVTTISVAQNLDLDVINLKHQTADEIIPIIQPFLIPEAAVTSRGYKLIIKSTPENLEQVKKIIAEVDAGLRQLTISVSIGQHSTEVENKTQAQIMAELKNNGTQLQVGSGGVSDSD